MEVLEIIQEIISSLGFPVAMVMYFIWDKTKVQTHLTEVIENNNLILQKLLVKLGEEDITGE